MPKSIEDLYEEADRLYYDGDLDKAASVYGKILKKDPFHQGALHSLGIIHYDQDDYRPAIDYMLKALEVTPDDQYVHSNLGKSLYGLHYMGEADDAVRLAREWMAAYPDNRIAQHMGAAVTGGEPPERASDDYVAQTFDEFADTFDDKLEELNYRAPALIAAALGEYLPAGEQDLRILDAGCGTGLCAQELAPFAARIDGIDLSAEMLEKAREREAYARLDQGDLGTLLARRKARYDVIVAADVLCYFGALEPIMQSFYDGLRDPGWLCFSLETAKKKGKARRGQGYRLEVSGRYVHDRDYVGEVLGKAGFTLLSMMTKTLRTEYGQPVPGVVVLAVKGDAG